MAKVSNEEMVREKYRSIFLTRGGREVLADILNDLGFMVMDVTDPEVVILQNAAKRILEKLGIWQGHNMKNIMNALLDMQYLNGGKSEKS